MSKTTIAIPKRVYVELLKEKEKLGARSIGEAVERILSEYRRLRRIMAVLEMIEKNKVERKISLEELLEDRRAWGRAREFS